MANGQANESARFAYEYLMRPASASVTETRLSRFFRTGLMVSGTCFGISFLLFFFLLIMGGPAGLFSGIIILGFAGLSLIFGAGHFFYVLFAKVQARLGEWMITFLVGASVAGILLAWFRGPDPSAESDAVATVITIFATVACTIVGSAWGWSICQQLNEQDGRRRLGILVRGWLLVIGAGAFAIFAVITLIGIAVMVGGGFLRDSGEFLTLGGTCLILSFCALPGLRLSFLARRTARDCASALDPQERYLDASANDA